MFLGSPFDVDQVLANINEAEYLAARSKKLNGGADELRVIQKMKNLSLSHKRKLFGVQPGAPSVSAERFLADNFEMFVIKRNTFDVVAVIIDPITEFKKNYTAHLVDAVSGALYGPDCNIFIKEFQFKNEPLNNKIKCTHPGAHRDVVLQNYETNIFGQDISGFLVIGQLYVGGVDGRQRRIKNVRCFNGIGNKATPLPFVRRCRYCD